MTHHLPSLKSFFYDHFYVKPSYEIEWGLLGIIYWEAKHEFGNIYNNFVACLGRFSTQRLEFETNINDPEVIAKIMEKCFVIDCPYVVYKRFAVSGNMISVGVAKKYFLLGKEHEQYYVTNIENLEKIIEQKNELEILKIITT